MATTRQRDLAILYASAWLRSFGIGLLGVVLGVFLFREGFSAIAIGLVIAAGLAGAAVGTVFVTLRADLLGRRRTLFALSLLTAMGLVALIFHPVTPLLVAPGFPGNDQWHGHGPQPIVCAGAGGLARTGL